MWLIFANQTEADILLRSDLEKLAAEYKPGGPAGIEFHLHYTLDRPPTDGSWKYSSGFINKDMCSKHLPPPQTKDGETMVFLCGPPPMIKFACEPALKELGYDEHQWFAF